MQKTCISQLMHYNSETYRQFFFLTGITLLTKNLLHKKIYIVDIEVQHS